MLNLLIWQMTTVQIVVFVWFNTDWPSLSYIGRDTTITNTPQLKCLAVRSTILVFIIILFSCQSSRTSPHKHSCHSLWHQFVFHLDNINTMSSRWGGIRLISASLSSSRYFSSAWTGLWQGLKAVARCPNDSSEIEYSEPIRTISRRETLHHQLNHIPTFLTNLDLFGM